MVKSLVSILTALALLFGLGVYEWFYVEDQFHDFGEEIQTLIDKAEREEVNAEDARAVQKSWENRKKNLNVWIPHNDILRIDDYVSETVRLVEDKNFELALARLETVLHLTSCLPATYRPTPDNIF